MKKTGLIVVGLLMALAAGCATTGGGEGPYRVSNYFVDEELRAFQDKTVAVLPFADFANAGSGRDEVTDQANLQLGATKLFDLVERIRISELFAEQDFDPNRLDEATAVRIGKMLGAHGVILGTITDYKKGRVGVSMRLVNVETGKQLWQARDTFNSDDSRVRSLVNDSYDVSRLRSEPSFLAYLLCRELAKTLTY